MWPVVNVFLGYIILPFVLKILKYDGKDKIRMEKRQTWLALSCPFVIHRGVCNNFGGKAFSNYLANNGVCNVFKDA